MKISLKKIKMLLFRHKWFILLILLAALIRFLYIKDNVVPFLFDHGRDALAVLHMLVTHQLKFVGQWTSIPGLNAGPAWYYLLAPFYFISGYNPASSAIAMSMMVLFEMYLVYKYFNLESAAIIGFSGFWIMISKSAWNPYPMTLLTIIIIILLCKQLNEKVINNKLLAGIAFLSSLGFHFSSAFAIFYPPIILFVLLIRKLRPKIKNVFIAFLAFVIPFIPQILFNIKNNFVEYYAIIDYFKGDAGGDPVSYEKIIHVLKTTFAEHRNIVFEATPGNNTQVLAIIFLIFVGLAVFYIKKRKLMDKKLSDLLLVLCVFLIIPLFGFSFLHFQLWYIYPIIPVFTIAIGALVNKLPKYFSLSFIAIYVICALVRVNYFLKYEKPLFLADSAMYSTKRMVTDYIISDADGRDFSVFTYKPDIYDFPYQYEFLVRGLKGEVLPLEFAYEPNVVSYVKEKPDLLEAIDKKYGQRWRGTPKVIYYIITEETDSELLGNWWGRQRYEQIIAEKRFGDRLVVYTAEPIKEE